MQQFPPRELPSWRPSSRLLSRVQPQTAVRQRREVRVMAVTANGVSGHSSALATSPTLWIAFHNSARRGWNRETLDENY